MLAPLPGKLGIDKNETGIYNTVLQGSFREEAEMRGQSLDLT